MPVTLTSTGITYSNGTSQNSAGTVLGAVQYTAYSGVNVFGQQGYQTAVAEILYLTSTAGQTSISMPASSSSVICGFQAYRSGVANNDAGDNVQDAGTIQRRVAYRTVS